MSDVTRILAQIESGNSAAADRLLPLVYDELRRLAAVKLGREKPGQTLQATALVHEAYLRLVGKTEGEKSEPGGQRSEVGGRSSEVNSSSDLRPPTSDLRARTSAAFDSRGHFFAAAATAMRRILVESARRKKRAKHGGELVRVEL